ncbi:phospholipid methyltransferase-domain-containing protein [Pisolithus sp. B1]|nr:phospholipid methyltransferase-domain-containing protein [Pisolithus sp. B1]
MACQSRLSESHFSCGQSRAMSRPSPKGLRKRTLTTSPIMHDDGCAKLQRLTRDAIVDEPEKPRPAREEVVWGKTPDGQVFRVPTTHDVLTALFHPAYTKSHLDILNLSLLGLQLILFYFLPRGVSKRFFLLYFVFWRTAYNAGLGWILTKQSKKRWIVREIQRLGWLDETRRPAMRRWIRAQLAGKMGKDYSFDDLPLEYNTWLLFRQLVDVILLNDFLAYCMFAFASFRVPEGLSLPVHVLRWIGGISLIVFNVWVKTEAHNVVKDYGWYWGDCFFQRGALVFDGVFELAPHPMYSVGYAGYYGLSLIVGSYPVLFVSLTAHAAQFAFLIFFENPHIERMYGKRKPIAVRKPLLPDEITKPREVKAREVSVSDMYHEDSVCDSTPSVTEGETASESELETETETDDVPTPRSQPKRSRELPAIGVATVVSSRQPEGRQQVSQHDLYHKYFRRDVVILQNIDLLRSSDVMLVLLILYLGVASCLPTLSHRTTLVLHFVHACAWCTFHSFGLGLLLRAQSQSKFIVRHFLKNYHYPSNDNGDGAVQEAFTNWKAIYNMSLCMTYISLGGLAWKTYSWPEMWSEGDALLRHTLGALFIGLHAWAARESYDVLGVFGWFYGDFFAEDFPAHLEYTGIFRYLDNPELMSGGSKLVGFLAVMRFVSHWWFLKAVENPHMRKLYGESLRKEAGFVKVIKNAATKNALLLESRAGRHAPDIRRVAKEVKGTFDKVFEETADVVEEFLAKSKPKISEVMQETKVLLQQSRERLIITRVANDLSSCDIAKYKLSILPSQSGNKRFHLGEPIRMQWQAPLGHSRRDWVGIYRVAANKSTLVTRTSTFGKWLPVHDEEWDGDVPLSNHRVSPKSLEPETGTLTFQGSTLPWNVGQYEVRYHHDGKYNVLSLDGPFEVYVEKHGSLDFDSVRERLAHIVPLCLDNDPSLIPLSCGGTGTAETSSDMGGAADGRDSDDFTFWSEEQAKRISTAIEEAFDVEYAPEVIMADANLTALAKRILVSKQLLVNS